MSCDEFVKNLSRETTTTSKSSITNEELAVRDDSFVRSRERERDCASCNIDADRADKDRDLLLQTALTKRLFKM